MSDTCSQEASVGIILLERAAGARRDVERRGVGELNGDEKGQDDGKEELCDFK